MKKERKARVIYRDGDKEGYAVEILTEDGWGLDTFFPLVRREGANEDEEKNFVHFRILNKLRELKDLSYTVVFM